MVADRDLKNCFSFCIFFVSSADYSLCASLARNCFNSLHYSK